MNFISRTPSRVLAIAATALTMALSTAYAAGGDMSGGTTQPGAAWHSHGGPMMKELGALHDQLKLTPDQEKLWQTALDTMKRNHEAQQANRKEMHEHFETLKQQPILDLNALDTEHKHFQQQNEQLRDSTSSAWLAVYNGLNDQQKKIVSDKLKQRFAAMEKHHEWRGEHWQHEHGASGPMPASQ